MFNQLHKYIPRIPSELRYRIDLMRHARKLPALSPQDKLIVEILRKEGVVTTSLQDLALPKTAELIPSAESQLANMELALAAKYKNTQKFGSGENPAYPQIFTVTDLPEFYHWGSEQRLLNIIENYIGLPIAFQGVHLRRDFANDEQLTTELWHLDAEDRRMIKVIIYLNDVSQENGPFEYIPKSQMSLIKELQIRSQIVPKTAKGLVGLNDGEIEKIVPKSLWKSCPGKAGSIVIADPRAIFHHGKPRTQSRSTLFFVYTAKNPLRPECCKQYSDQTFARVLPA
ncbi:phytanoyl-CoA dioxygenase family protein [Nostoc linckia FACHB-104]|nr:phytanoyl-CoA dioxygenase family protein [Nostoc linckia FACHB-104]